MPEKRIIIVGGGLAGLVTSLHLAKEGIASTVIEKNHYPFHRVCGEYISQEVVPYLNRMDAYPEACQPVRINRFLLTSTRGDAAELPLDPGGFGISRYALDNFLYERARQLGVNFMLDAEVTGIRREGEVFHIEIPSGTFEAEILIAAHGKRSRVDKHLDRAFISRSSPYVGVKYHIRLPGFPHGLIALHNFRDGYCGISRVEKGAVNLCYLTHRDNVRAHGSLKAVEEAVLFQNPFLREIFQSAEFLFEKPETINEISFEVKGPLEDHILFCGDAAGMITPLCGNGMAMAIHSAKLLAECVVQRCRDMDYPQAQLEVDYAKAWTRQFARRLWAGRTIQRLFGGDRASRVAVLLAQHVKPVARHLIGLTHGKPF